MTLADCHSWNGVAEDIAKKCRLRGLRKVECTYDRVHIIAVGRIDAERKS